MCIPTALSGYPWCRLVSLIHNLFERLLKCVDENDDDGDGDRAPLFSMVFENRLSVPLHRSFLSLLPLRERLVTENDQNSANQNVLQSERLKIKRSFQLDRRPSVFPVTVVAFRFSLEEALLQFLIPFSEPSALLTHRK